MIVHPHLHVSRTFVSDVVLYQVTFLPCDLLLSLALGCFPVVFGWSLQCVNFLRYVCFVLYFGANERTDPFNSACKWPKNALDPIA